MQIVSPEGGIAPLLFNSTTRDGYTSEIAAWLALSTGGEDIGLGAGDGSGYVTIDPDLWSTSSAATVQCTPPCTYVLPPLTLPEETTFSFPLLTTSLTVGYYTNYSFTYRGSLTTTNSYVSSLKTTVITIPAVTTSVLSWFEYPVNASTTTIYPQVSVTQTSFVIPGPSSINGTMVPPSNRTFYPPPWPGSTVPPALEMSPTSTATSTTPVPLFGVTSVHHSSGPPKPTCTHASGCGHRCGSLDVCFPCWLFCDGPPGK